MVRTTSCLFVISLLCGSVCAQTSPLNAIQATGNASISVNPDQAQLNVGVITQGTTAQEAGQQNATLTSTVISAMTGVLGSAGKVQTVGYSITPRYSNAPGQSSTIVGYTATNTLQATIADLSAIGRLIDAANQAGASNVGSLTFGLQNPEPVQEQALQQAAKLALAHAGAIAAGLGAKTGMILSAQEGSTVVPVVIGTAGAASATTPIVTGAVTVSATVTVNVQLTQ